LLPRPHLELTSPDGPLHIDTRFTKPLEMVLSLLGIDDVDAFLGPIEALLDERAKHPVLLLDAVEESANVTFPAENATGKLHGMFVGSHTSPHVDSGDRRR